MERNKGVGRLNIIKMSILHVKVNKVLVKIPASFFCTIGAADSKIYMERHSPQITQS